MSEKLNQDLHTRVVMRTHDMAWQASPSPSVWRKRLDLVGPAEAGRVTSVVRYDAASTFDAHDHPDGEEILVLAGTFSDEHGHYPQGTFVLNPQGFRHAPYSEDGCILFVKLRQYPGTDRVHVAVDTASAPWVAEGDPGRCVIHLYADPAYPESIHFTRLDAGTHVPSHEHPAATKCSYWKAVSRTNSDATRLATGSGRRPAASTSRGRTTAACCTSRKAIYRAEPF